MRKIVLLTLLTGVSFTPACRKEKDIREIIAENSCIDALKDSSVGERTKKLAQKVLDGWANKVVDGTPVLVHAGCAPGEEPRGRKMLFLTMSDEEFDIKGIVIREVKSEPNGSKVILQEDYPVFPSGIGHFQYLFFSARKNPSERKDEKAWTRYLDSNVDTTYQRGDHPRIWLSLPNEPNITIEIWVYDSKGNRSEGVPLEYGVPSGHRRQK